jgi:hypothetical protein
MLNRLFGLSIIWCAALFGALLFMIFAYYRAVFDCTCHAAALLHTFPEIRIPLHPPRELMQTLHFQGRQDRYWIQGRHREAKLPLANVGFWAEAKCYRPDELNRSCGSRPIIKSTFVQFVWNENLRSAWSPEGWRQRELGRVPDAQILFPQTLKWANGAGPSRHFASQPKRSMRPRRSLHAFDSQEICQQREEHLPCLGGVGRRTHDLCRERKRRHREALRPHFGAGGLGTFFPEYRFYS